jgi:hypothetical protein
MHPWWWHRSGKTAEQGEWIEVDGDGAITKWTAQLDAYQAIVEQVQALLGDRRPLTPLATFGAGWRRASAGSRSANASSMTVSSASSSITPWRISQPSARMRIACKRSASSALESDGNGWKTSSPAAFGAKAPSRKIE